MKQQRIQNLIDAFMSVDNRDFEKRILEEYSEIGDHPLYGFKYAGSNAEKRGGAYIYQELQKIGVDHIEKVPVSSGMFQCNDVTLTVVEGAKVGTTYKPGPYITPGTDAEGITGELLDLGNGMLEDFEANDVKGKILLIDGAHGVGGADHIPPIMNADHRGAAAVIIYQRSGAYDENTVRTQPTNEIPGIPVIGMSLKDVTGLLEMMREGTVVVNLCIDSILKEKDAESYSIIGEIKGEIPDERIIISGHLDHYFKCLQDDISAVATNLSIAKAMIDSGYKPRRTITFLFVSSHETGAFFSSTPYIHGSYQLMAEAKKDWKGKVLAAINFEYTALKLKKLRAFGSYEFPAAYRHFVEYMPKRMPCYGEIDPELGFKDEYYLMAWADSISYINRGIPVIMNDSITEQFTEEGSPYTGRDHSTSDNWGCVDLEGLYATTKWFGALAIYLAETALPEYDFSQRAAILKPTEEEKKVLANAGIATDEYERVVSRLADGGKKLIGLVTECNQNTAGDDFCELSQKIMEIQVGYSAATDWINGAKFLQVPYKKYCHSIKMITEAISLLQDGDAEKALFETLVWVDMGNVAVYHGEYPSRRMKEIHETEEMQDWREGRETSVLFLTDIISEIQRQMKEKEIDYSHAIAMLKEVAANETKLLKEAFRFETEALADVLLQLRECIQMFS